MKAITVRNIPPDLAEAIDDEKLRRGHSLNRTVIDLLKQALGVGRPRSNGLARLAGGLSRERARELEEAMAPLGEIDEEMWR
ncbi:MAG: hypothetical protein OXG58_04410 [Gemmatimonadetes bacterium]|nr:hypothetical protein [Gemmatimonadota bacterium]MCY3943178.1 hypothetical protein [Gemmatimonadota bacterium]